MLNLLACQHKMINYQSCLNSDHFKYKNGKKIFYNFKMTVENADKLKIN